MASQTFSAIAQRLGAPLKNTRWSWCSLSPDRKRAVFTLWQDKFARSTYPITYHDDRRVADNANRPGWNELDQVVAHCLEHPETEALGVLCIAVDPKADPRVRKEVDGRDIRVLSIERGEDSQPVARIVGILT